MPKPNMGTEDEDIRWGAHAWDGLFPEDDDDPEVQAQVSRLGARHADNDSS